MGSGLAGGPLTGSLTTAALPPAPAGQSAVLSGPLGAGASDVVTKAGSTLPLGIVNAAAHVFSVRTGISGSETELVWVDGSSDIRTVGVVGTSGWFRGQSATQGFLLIDDTNGAVLRFNAMQVGVAAAAITLRNSGVGNLWSLASNGRVDQYGTDSTGSPGAATIDKPTGKSSIAIGAASVTITCNVCVAASRVMITPHARDATCKELIVVPGAGSFVVSGSANATAALPFSWEVSNII